MILRDIQQYRVRDATTDTLIDKPLDYRPILAPLLDWVVEIVEQRMVLVEPQSGSLGMPDANAFMVVVPPSFAVGQMFGIELFGTDWESEGFAVGDELEMAMGYILNDSIFLTATIQGISGTIATFRISSTPQIFGTLDTQQPFPLVAFLVNERFDIRSALLRAGDSGFISPLNGQPFYVNGHSNHIEIFAYSITNSTNRYNLRFYSATQEAVIDALLPNARNLKFVTIAIWGTQFYAYRSSLDPTASVPTQAYPTRGKIVIDAEAPNTLRNLNFETDCLLLHPNRIEETNNFVTPGTLTITGSSASINVPSIPFPVRQAVCLLGPDSHHSLQSVFSSIELTQTTIPPSIPPSRRGADYVGVVTGQIVGQWVAVMTNRVPSMAAISGPFDVAPHQGPIYRYDSLYGVLSVPNSPAGIYIIQTLLKVGNSFVPIDEIEFNTADIVTLRFPATSAYTSRSNIYPIELAPALERRLTLRNYDLEITRTTAFFSVPLPSRRLPPNIPFALTQPTGGYGRDLNNWAGGPITLKWRLFAPDGNVYDSKELTFPTTFTRDTMRFEPDRQLATITETATTITALRSGATPPNTSGWNTFIRAAVFARPEGYKPVMQTMAYFFEDYSSSSVIESYSEGHVGLVISRPPLGFRQYTITLNKSALPPGQYTLHVRHSVRQSTAGSGWVITEDESYLYDFTIPAPQEPPSGPPLALGLCDPKIPAISGESWEGLYKDENGDWQTFNTTITGCELPNYCGCFELTSDVPDNYIDIIGHFRGAIRGKVVPDGARHKARFRGRIIRLADEYATEDFVSSLYKAEDVVRSYTQKYQIELFLQTPCDLVNLDLLKFAWKWDVTNRSNKLLASLIRDIVPGEIDISDSGRHIRATITLKTLTWRDEYRRQG